MSANKIIINGVTILDLTNDTATPETVVYGRVFHAADGSQSVGALRYGENGLELLILDDGNGNVTVRTVDMDDFITEDDRNGNVTVRVSEKFQLFIEDDGNGNVTMRIEDGERETYAVTYILTDVLKTTTVASVVEGKTFFAGLISNNGYSKSFVSITVTMGGVDVTADCVTISESGDTAQVSIHEATGDIIIMAVGGILYPVATYFENATCSTVEAMGGTNPTLYIEANSGFVVLKETAIVTMGGVDVTADCVVENIVGDITIQLPTVTGDVVVTATAVEAVG